MWLFPVTAAVLAARYHVHMLQLNFYVPGEYMGWCRRTWKMIVPHGISLALVLVALMSFWMIESNDLNGIEMFSFVFPVALVFILVHIFIHPLGIVMYWPHKAKKPLVYTPRVRRLMATILILIIILGLITLMLVLYKSNNLKDSAILLVTLVAVPLPFALMPLWMLLALAINQPIEKAINRRYLRDAKRRLAEHPGLTVIGVTGSYGKTSVKFFLGGLLGVKYNVLITPESYNTPMGVVRTIRERLLPTHEIFVCEMGAKRLGEIREICDIVSPRHGVITSVGPQHLETFGSLENIKKTKFELVDALPPDGTLFLNGDDGNIAAYAGTRAAIRYGMGEGNDFRALDVSADSRGTTFTVSAPDGPSENFSTRLLGEHNVVNVTGAIAVAVSLGVPLARLRLAVSGLQPVPHRLELSGTPERLIIDDAFNSNPSGAAAALKALALFDACRIIVTPGMVELGPRQDELNQRFGEQIAEICHYVFLVGKKQTRPIYEGLMGAGYPPEKVFVVEQVQEAVAAADALPGQKKVILLENDLPDDY